MKQTVILPYKPNFSREYTATVKPQLPEGHGNMNRTSAYTGSRPITQIWH